MRVTNLTEDSELYTSNAYFIRGDWNKLLDVNAMVDVGRDPKIMDLIADFPTGLGKKRLERVVLTHSHYDHVGILGQIKKRYNPEVCAMNPYLEGVDHILKDGELLRLGDRDFQVLHCPGHSSDSICLLCEQEGVLFTGDTPILIRDTQGVYEHGLIQAMQSIVQKGIERIYPGHSQAMQSNCSKTLARSLDNLLQSRIVNSGARDESN